MPQATGIWLLEHSTTYPSSLAADTFVGQVPGGSAVTIQGTDVSHTVILGPNGLIEATF